MYEVGSMKRGKASRATRSASKGRDSRTTPDRRTNTENNPQEKPSLSGRLKQVAVLFGWTIGLVASCIAIRGAFWVEPDLSAMEFGQDSVKSVFAIENRLLVTMHDTTLTCRIGNMLVGGNPSIEDLGKPIVPGAEDLRLCGDQRARSEGSRVGSGELAPGARMAAKCEGNITLGGALRLRLAATVRYGIGPTFLGLSRWTCREFEATPDNGKLHLLPR